MNHYKHKQWSDAIDAGKLHANDNYQIYSAYFTLIIATYFFIGN